MKTENIVLGKLIQCQEKRDKFFSFYNNNHVEFYDRRVEIIVQVIDKMYCNDQDIDVLTIIEEIKSIEAIKVEPRRLVTFICDCLDTPNITGELVSMFSKNEDGVYTVTNNGTNIDIQFMRDATKIAQEAMKTDDYLSIVKSDNTDGYVVKLGKGIKIYANPTKVIVSTPIMIGSGVSYENIKKAYEDNNSITNIDVLLNDENILNDIVPSAVKKSCITSFFDKFIKGGK